VATSNGVTLQVVSAVTPTVAINTPGAVCEGLPLTFTATSSGGGTVPTYQWYVNGNPVGTGGITYTDNTLVGNDEVYVEMTSDLACVVAGTNPATSNKVKVDVRVVPAPVINEPDQEFCSGNSFTYTVTATSPSNKLQWRKDGVNIAGATSISYVATQSGVYTVTEDNGACATTTLGVTVEVVQSPGVYAGEDQYVIEQSLVQLNASGASAYVWTPSTGLSSATVSNPTLTAVQTITYVVTGTNTSTSGNTTCTGSDDVTIVVVRPIKIPNAISPNGDNVNDDWVIENIEGFPNCEVEVYNRYGSLVWKSTGYKTNWAGVNFRNGEVLPDGTYFYVIDLKSEVFKDPYKGYIQIVK
jgi:gliding motility-associated-like protein